jgi:hypothetical protein
VRELLEEIMVEIADSRAIQTAAAFHMAFCRGLRRRGWDVQTEVEVKADSDFRGGFVDILAQRGLLRMAVELDRGNPRKKSIEKLIRMKCYRVCILRTGKHHDRPSGIDLILGMKSITE